MDRYVRSFENADVNGLVDLLTDDVVLEMPPVPRRYRGKADYARFMAHVFARRGTRWRLVPVGANTQPALAAYCRGDDGVPRLHTLQVFTVTRACMSHHPVFQDPQVFEAFALPGALGR